MGCAQLPSQQGLIQEEESALCLSPRQRHEELNTGRESSPALGDLAVEAGAMGGNFSGWGLPLHHQPPSLEVGELGLRAVTAGWDDPSGSSRALEVLRGLSPMPGEVEVLGRVRLSACTQLLACVWQKKKGLMLKGLRRAARIVRMPEIWEPSLAVPLLVAL